MLQELQSLFYPLPLHTLRVCRKIGLQFPPFKQVVNMMGLTTPVHPKMCAHHVGVDDDESIMTVVGGWMSLSVYLHIDQSVSIRDSYTYRNVVMPTAVRASTQENKISFDTYIKIPKISNTKFSTDSKCSKFFKCY